MPADTDMELLGKFTEECRECIEGAERALLGLEIRPDDAEAVNTVFRAFHTVKGTSAFLGLPRVSEFAHLAENLLSRVRDREIRMTGGYADLALRSVDMLRELMTSVERSLTGQPMEEPNGYAHLMEMLANPEKAGLSAELDDLVIQPPRLGDILKATGKINDQDLAKAASNQGNEPIGVAIIRSGGATLTDVAKALRLQRRVASAEGVETSMRVSTERLDHLIDMIGELVIAHSMVCQDAIVANGMVDELTRKVGHAGEIVRDLQNLGMSLRMVPLKTTFQKMIRLVRDLAQKSNKAIEVVIEDKETEIDRNMVDVISDLLLHMMRNAVDHGIEAPDLRQQQGKPRTGTIVLSASQAGGNVVVQIQDDGRGLDRNKIIERAIANGLIDRGKAMTDSEVFDLIFEPGFSTAEKITNVSGRGVGMDVVKRGVESLRGQIEVRSTPAKGTTFTIRLPLTLAIVEGMLVKVGNERYIIPSVSIQICFVPEPGALSTVQGRGEIVTLRGEVMPLVRLHELFEVPEAVQDPTEGLLVVVSDNDRQCAILVDELLEQQQVVAKPLGAELGKIAGVSGGAILGTGRVGLILDPLEIVSLARDLGCRSRGGNRHDQREKEYELVS